ncbi:cytochrome P450 [Cubamyces lactineus]|nr:cytochrome P450 [Cubamyces lactineus]
MIFYFAAGCLVWLLWRAIRIARARSVLAKVPGPPSASILTGNLTQLVDRQGWDFHTEIAERYAPVIKLQWLFGAPCLYVFDPLALHHIIKDPSTYDELPWYLESNCLFIGPGILGVSGNIHRKQRKMLTPVFSAKHMRGLMPVFYRVTDKLVEAISSRVDAGAKGLDVLGWMSRAALELIGQSGIGHSFDPLTEDVADDYADAVKHFTAAATDPQLMLLRQATPLVPYLGPAWFRRWVIEKIPLQAVQRIIQITDVLHTGSVKIFEEKKAAASRNEKTEGQDIISILLRANQAASAEDRLSDDQLLGQMSAIIFAAMDTTSNAMARTLHLLAQHPKVQNNLRSELVEARRSGHLDYDALHALPYLDAVCRETLRLYAPASQTFRGTMKDAVLPLSQPIRATDGTLMNEIVIPRGTNILIGIMACNRNKAIWGEDASEWKPERWLRPLPEALEKASMPGVYSHMMTFLGGVRSCIGFTFSQLEMKVVLSELLTSFAFDLSDKPVVWNLAGVSYPSISTESTKGELWLKVRKLSED